MTTFVFRGQADNSTFKKLVEDFAQKFQGTFKYSTDMARYWEGDASYFAIIPPRLRSAVLQFIRDHGRNPFGPDLYFVHCYPTRLGG